MFRRAIGLAIIQSGEASSMSCRITNILMALRVHPMRDISACVQKSRFQWQLLKLVDIRDRNLKIDTHESHGPGTSACVG